MSYVTPPRTAVLRSRGGVTHSGETRLGQLPAAVCDGQPCDPVTAQSADHEIPHQTVT